MFDEISEGREAEQLILEILKVLKRSIFDLTFIRANYWILGLSFEETPNHTIVAEMLVNKQKEFKATQKKVQRARRSGKRVRVTNLRGELQALTEGYTHIEDTKRLYTEGDSRICREGQEQAIIALAERVIAEGRVKLTISEFGMMYDLSQLMNDWFQLPNCTLIFIGHGISVSSPEANLFEAMAHFHDKSVATHREMTKLLPVIEDSERTAEQYLSLSHEHNIYLRQTLINAFLLLEAFINSLAYVYIRNSGDTLDENTCLYLEEKRKGKSGSTTTQYVSTDKKLVEWTKIISPRDETFDKGRKPYQEYRKLKTYRDAIVHQSAPKIAKVREIDLQIALDAVDASIAMIQDICQFTSPDTSCVQSPFWLIPKDKEGFFRYKTSFTIDIKQ